MGICDCATVQRNAVAPVALQITVNAGNSGIDLTEMTAAVLIVLKPDGTEHTWTAVLDADENIAVLEYAFAAGAVEVTGTYVATPYFTSPGGVYPANSITFDVVGPGREVAPTPGAGALVFAVKLKTNLVGG